MKIRYIDRLLSHPGLIFPVVFSIYGFLAGGFSSNVPSFAFGAIAGVLASAPMWAIVLWTACTACTQPVDPSTQEGML